MQHHKSLVWVVYFDNFLAMKLDLFESTLHLTKLVVHSNKVQNTQFIDEHTHTHAHTQEKIRKGYKIFKMTSQIYICPVHSFEWRKTFQ